MVAPEEIPMIKRTTGVGLTVLLLCGCADTTTSLSQAPAPAGSYSQDQLAEAGLYAIQRKQRTLRTRGPKPFDQPAEAHEFFVRQRLSDGQLEYPWPHLAQTAPARSPSIPTTPTSCTPAAWPAGSGSRPTAARAGTSPTT
jgi:hypothetical protein